MKKRALRVGQPHVEPHQTLAQQHLGDLADPDDLTGTAGILQPLAALLQIRGRGFQLFDVERRHQRAALLGRVLIGPPRRLQENPPFMLAVISLSQTPAARTVTKANRSRYPRSALYSLLRMPNVAGRVTA